ncbi:MAG: FG-GAP-like repeat-containing protein [Phycisphaerae bacterium]|jgi:hypothetical protein
MRHRAYRNLAIALTLTILALPCACETQYIPEFLGGGLGTARSTGGGIFATPGAFTENLVQARTFTDGTSVTTVTYLVDDIGGLADVDEADVLLRRPYGIDFNGDGKIDPVVGYGKTQGVIQILLSDPTSAAGEVDLLSLTLDSKRDMEDLADVAVGDIDRDGALDIVAAAEGSLWYFHHPTGQPTTALHLWGNTDTTDDLRERVDASYTMLTDSELQAVITQAIGPGVNLDDYVVTIEQLYTNVEIGDMDNDGDNDLVASRSFVLTLTPKPDIPVEPLQIVDGDVLAFINPGFADNGHGWTGISIGRHERQQRLDRDGASDLFLYDLDTDGDLDVISAARKDNNVQVAWFENPVQRRSGSVGPGLSTDDVWFQWRIGSVRDAWGMDVADLTGDGRPDVVATGGEQMQMVLFVQPDTGPQRAWDWDTHVLVTYSSYEPRDVKALDLDNDGVLELVTGGSSGAVRYYEWTTDPTDPWTPSVVLDYDPPGEVGWLGYGDLDGDGDLDLVAVVAGEDDNDSRITWIRNDTYTLLP